MAKVISMFSDYWLRREPVAERGRMSATRTVSDIESSARATVLPSGATRMRERELAVRPSEVVAGAAARGGTWQREAVRRPLPHSLTSGGVIDPALPNQATPRREGASGTVGAAERGEVTGRECGAATPRREGASGTVGAAERGEVTRRECGAATPRREGAAGTVGAEREFASEKAECSAAGREVVSRGRECGAAECEAGASEVTERDIRAAKRCGVALDEWMRMTKKARKRAHLEYLAAKKGMSVEEMRADRDRRMAAKYGMPLECWRKMPLQARILYMWRVKSERRARARKDRVSDVNTNEVN